MEGNVCYYSDFVSWMTCVVILIVEVSVFLDSNLQTDKLRKESHGVKVLIIKNFEIISGE
jgi:hypothetical protein